MTLPQRVLIGNLSQTTLDIGTTGAGATARRRFLLLVIGAGKVCHVVKVSFEDLYGKLRRVYLFPSWMLDLDAANEDKVCLLWNLVFDIDIHDCVQLLKTKCVSITC